LAAAKAALDKVKRENVTATLAERGGRLMAGVEERIARHDCAGFLRVSGHPSWSFLTIADQPNASQFEIKTLYLQEVIARGILTIGTHNISFAHRDADIDRLLAVYDEVFPLLRDALRTDGGVIEQLRCEPLQPLFRVR
jgi:glutamate-1-semialdehyde 2,1-aminomutase